jgi:tRNA G18 (ribose-2'-O)-methylase SpoU
MIVIGRNPVKEILASGKDVAKIYLRFGAHGESFSEIYRLAGERKIPVVTLPKVKFDRLGGMEHSRISSPRRASRTPPSSSRSTASPTRTIWGPSSAPPNARACTALSFRNTTRP